MVMWKDVFVIKKNTTICFIICILFICVFTSCGKGNKNNTKEVDIYNVVKEAYLTDKGYTSELSKHMSKEMFEKTNIYSIYNINTSDSKKLYKIDFNLKEDSQEKEKDIVCVKMIYSFEMTDLKNNTIGGSKNVPVTFIVKKTGTNWYIVKKYEPA